VINRLLHRYSGSTDFEQIFNNPRFLKILIFCVDPKADIEAKHRRQFGFAMQKRFFTPMIETVKLLLSCCHVVIAFLLYSCWAH
jgi:hypothetical protein